MRYARWILTAVAVNGMAFATLAVAGSSPASSQQKIARLVSHGAQSPNQEMNLNGLKRGHPQSMTTTTIARTTGPNSTSTSTTGPTSNSTTTTGPTSNSTTTTVPPSTTTTLATTSTTTTTIPSGTAGNCTDPVWSSSNPEDTYNVDPNDGEYWWVNNDAWNGSAGPQSIYVCNQSSWYAVSDQPNDGGAVETYPDTEYDLGGRNSLSIKPISQYNSITSTFSEDYPSAGSWDAAYDLWLNNWDIETMIWNQWSGSQDYWPDQATISLSLDGVPYKFYDNGGELMFFRQAQVTSGSVDILAAYDWLVQNGYVKASDVPTQLEYGVEICSTAGNETFPMTGLTFSTS